MTDADGDRITAAPTAGRRALTFVPVAALIAVVVVGGALALHQWRSGPAAAPGTPPSLTGAAMAYDPTSGTVIMFGGSSGTADSNQTWQWDGTQWSLLDPAHSPSARSGASLAYDPASGDLVLVGGESTTHATSSGCTNSSSGVVAPSLPASVPGGMGSAGGASGSSGAEPAVTPAPTDNTIGPGPTPTSLGVLPGGVIATLPPSACGPFTTTGVTNDSDTWVWDGSDWTEAAATTPAGEAGLVTDTQSGSLLMLTATLNACDTCMVPNSGLNNICMGVGASAPGAVANGPVKNAALPSTCGIGSQASDYEVSRWHNGGWSTVSGAGFIASDVIGMATDPVSGHAVVFTTTTSGGDGLCSTGVVAPAASGAVTDPIACPMIPVCSPPIDSQSSTSTVPVPALACPATTRCASTAESAVNCPAVSVTEQRSALIWNGSAFVAHSESAAPSQVSAVSADPANDDVIAYTVDGATYRWSEAGGWDMAQAASAPGALSGEAVAVGPDGAPLLMGGNAGVAVPVASAASSGDAADGSAANDGYRWTGSTWLPLLAPTASASASASPSASASASASPTAPGSPAPSPSASGTPTPTASASAVPSQTACPETTTASASACPSLPIPVSSGQ